MRPQLRIAVFVLLAAFGLCVVQTSAQTQTTVTGQVLDPNGIPYSGARLTITLNNPGPGSATVTPCHSPSSGCPVSLPGTVTLDNNGNIPGGGIVLWANASILPAGTTYSFQVNETPGVLLPWGTGPQIFTLANQTISGSTQDLTAAFVGANPPPLTLFGTASGGGTKPTVADGIFYVTTEGSDANDCRSWGTACATVNGAEGKMPAGGGTIDVGSGVFTAQAVLSKPTFLLCNGLGAPTELTIPNGTNASAVSITSSNTRVSQCLVDGDGAGQTAGNGISIDAPGLSNIVIDHNMAQNAFGAGIAAPQGASALRIENNSLSGNGQPSASGTQISYVEPAGSGDGEIFIHQNDLDATAQNNSCIEMIATTSAGNPTIIASPSITANSCVQGSSSGYATYGIRLFADTSGGSQEEITGANVNGNTVNGSGGTASTPAIVQSQLSALAQSWSFTANHPVTAGNEQFMWVLLNNSGSIPSITDSLGNVWTEVASGPVGGTTDNIELWESPITHSGTPTLSGTAGGGGLGSGDTVFWETSGLGAHDTRGTAQNGTGTSFTSGPITTTVANDFVFSCAANDGTSVLSQSVYTPIFVSGALPCAFSNVSGSGAQSVPWTLSVSDNWGSVMDSFAPASGAASALAVGLDAEGTVDGPNFTSNSVFSEAGIALLSGTNSANVSANNFTGNGAGQGAAAVTITSSSNNLVDGNVILDFAGSGAGAIGVDITNSASTDNCIGVNIFTSVTTPISDSGTTTGCPNSGAGGGGSTTVTTKLLAANVALPPSTLTTVDTQTVTMPSTGCPCRVQISYSYFWEQLTGSAPNVVNIYVTDGTSNYAISQSGPGVASTTTALGATATQTTAAYANGAVVTFTVKAEGVPTNRIDSNAFVVTAAQSYLELKVTTSGSSGGGGGGGGGTNYQSVSVNGGAALPGEPTLTLIGAVSCVDNPGVSTNCTFAGAGGGFSPPISSVGGGITGTFNGSNVTFTLSSTPPNPGSLVLFLNGVFQIQGTNYTLSGATITMAVAPSAGGQLVAY
jgi:hypothetical protein